MVLTVYVSGVRVLLYIVVPEFIGFLYQPNSQEIFLHIFV